MNDVSYFQKAFYCKKSSPEIVLISLAANAHKYWAKKSLWTRFSSGAVWKILVYNPATDPQNVN